MMTVRLFIKAMLDPNHDHFTDITLGHTMVDWEDKTLTPDRISVILMGSSPWSYWELPEYEGMEHWDIEAKILLEAGRPNWGSMSKHGKPLYQHMLTLAKLMFPLAHITPAIHDTFAFFCMAIGGANRKGLNLIGSQNAGKSYGSCLIAFVTMFIDPAYSMSFVANVYKNAAQSQVWGTVKELWWELCDAHPNNTGTGLSKSCALFPWGQLYADSRLEFVPGLPKAGVIRLQDVNDEGKFRGTKSFGKDVTRGVLLLIVDEINLIRNHSFLGMIDNLSSQDSFLSISSQNFKDTQDLGGRITEPVGLFGGPRSFDELNIDSSIWWHSIKSSVTLRFDGERSPNILLGKTIYDKLFKLENLQHLSSQGKNHPSYLCQVRSFPTVNSDTNSVLSRAKISASRHLDPFFTLTNLEGGVSFTDPAFGGRDDAVWGCMYFGKGTITEGDGEQVYQDLVVFKEHFHRLKLVKGAIYPGDPRGGEGANYWKDRMKAAGIDTSTFFDGQELSYEDQIAIQVKELNRKNGIPDANSGYDFSMRPDIVSSMNKIVGFACHAFDYNQKPEGCFLQSIKQNSEDCCKNRCTELAMLAADLFLTKQVRGGSLIELAITQLSRTLLETVNQKFVAEGKKEYKARWNNDSPDHRDVLMGLAGMAQRKGFRRSNVGAYKSGKSSWSEINAGGFGKSKVGKRLR